MSNFRVTIEVSLVKVVDFNNQQLEEFLDWMYSSSHISPDNPLYKEHIEGEVMIAELVEYEAI